MRRGVLWKSPRLCAASLAALNTFSKLSNAVASETNNYRRRLEELENNSFAADDESSQRELEKLRCKIDELEAKTSMRDQSPERTDPDEARRIVEESKTVRGQLSRLEHFFETVKCGCVRDEQLPAAT